MCQPHKDVWVTLVYGQYVVDFAPIMHKEYHEDTWRESGIAVQPRFDSQEEAIAWVNENIKEGHHLNVR